MDNTFIPIARYTAYVHTNRYQTQRYGNDLRRLTTKMLSFLDEVDSYGWIEIVDNRTNEIVHRSRKSQNLAACS